MLEHSNRDADPAAPRAKTKNHERAGDAASAIDSVAERITADLARQRVRLRLLHSANGPTAGGAAFRVSVGQALQSAMASDHLMRRVTTLVQENAPVTLSLTDLGAEDEAIGALEDFCRGLRSALDAQSLPCDRIGISLQSHLVPLQAYLLICTAILGAGPRYVILDSLQMRHHDNELVQAEADSNWSILWRRRSSAPTIFPAYAAGVTTHCPLLGDEAAAVVLPELGLQVPAESAWLPMEIHLPDFSDGRGRLRWTDLQQSLETAVDGGDRLIDHLHWPLPQQRSDAWQNRRLAIVVGGIGDLVVERGADPADLRCLKWLDHTLARLHALMWDRSRSLAQKSQPLPALLANWPTVRWDCDVKRGDWDSRWRRAVANSAVRHRNLLALSPYSVLPSGGSSPADFIDLLPVLHHADAFSFSRPNVQGFRSCSEFTRFHRRAWAVMQRRNAASLVAAGV